jgi:hypothetical protein
MAEATLNTNLSSRLLPRLPPGWHPRAVFGLRVVVALVLTGGNLVTDGRVTQIFRKEKLRSNNSHDGNYLLLRGILSKLMSSNVLQS